MFPGIAEEGTKTTAIKNEIEKKWEELKTKYDSKTVTWSQLIDFESKWECM